MIWLTIKSVANCTTDPPAGFYEILEWKGSPEPPNIIVYAYPDANYKFVKWSVHFGTGGAANPFFFYGNPLQLSDGNTEAVVVTVVVQATDGNGEPPPPPPPPKTAAARVPMMPQLALHLLWRLRERFISKEVHKRLHPLV